MRFVALSRTLSNHTLQRTGEQRCFTARWSGPQSGVVPPPPLSCRVGQPNGRVKPRSAGLIVAHQWSTLSGRIPAEY